MKFSSGFFADNTFTPWFFTWPVESEAAPQESTVGGKSSRSRDTDDDLIRQVLDKWETIDAIREIDALAKDVPVHIEVESDSTLGPPNTDGAPMAYLAQQTVEALPAPFSPDKAAAALAARRRNDEEALILMLLEL
jgi:hypothetical protein